MLQFSDSHSIVTRSSRVSRAPPYPNLPALLNLHDSKKLVFFIKNVIFAINFFVRYNLRLVF